VGTSERLRGGVDDAGAVVHRLRPPGARPCARPGCPDPAAATLTFRYAAQEAVVELLVAESRPQAYDLCLAHAARTSPPRGWTLRDRRPEDARLPADATRTPPDLGGDRTVAVLAAALRAVPDAASERAVTDRPAEIGAAASTSGPTDTSTDGPVAAASVAVDDGPASATALTLLDDDDAVPPSEPPRPDEQASVDVVARAVPRPPLAVRDREGRAADW
jgi:hypothetical protein